MNWEVGFHLYGFSHCNLSWERLKEVGLALGSKDFFIAHLGPSVNWFWKQRQQLAGSVHGSGVSYPLPHRTSGVGQGAGLVRNYNICLDSKRVAASKSDLLQHFLCLQGSVKPVALWGICRETVYPECAVVFSIRLMCTCMGRWAGGKWKAWGRGLAQQINKVTKVNHGWGGKRSRRRKTRETWSQTCMRGHHGDVS